MDVALVDEDSLTGSQTFAFTGVDIPLFNAVRVGCMEDVRCHAFADMSIYGYDAGPMYHEMMASRFGQIPLRAKQGACIEGAKFGVHVAASPDNHCVLTWITSKHLVPLNSAADHVEIVHSRSPEEAMVAPQGFPIVPLHPGQFLHAEFTVHTSTGRQEGTRWKQTSCTQGTVNDTTRTLRIETTGGVTPRHALVCSVREIVQSLNVALDALVT